VPPAARREVRMPLFLDVHNGAFGVTAEAMAEAHAKDLAVQAKYGVRYLQYWYDPVSGKVFCLSDAPSKEAALAVHREAHGVEADDIFEVLEGS
jgi:Protein of unknown function (DUF4242)